MEKSTTVKKSDIQKKVKSSNGKLLKKSKEVIATKPEVKVKAGNKPKPPTMEDLKKDPVYQKQIRDLAANIQATVPNTWINYKRYVKHFKGVSPEAFYSMVHTIKAFDMAVVKTYKNEIRFQIDFNHSVEIQLINDDIAAYEDMISKLVDRKKVLGKLIEEANQQELLKAKGLKKTVINKKRTKKNVTKKS